VQNVGQGAVEISAVYVDGELQNNVAYNPSAQIPEGSTIEITINGNFNLDERHDIKVTTTSGTSMTLSKVKPATGGSSGGTGTAALTGSFTAPAATTVDVGDSITVTMRVTNTGTASETGVTPSALTLGGTGSATLSSGPSPASATIAGGDSQDFTWTYTAASAGTVTFSGSATGTGQYSGDSVTTGSVWPSNAVTINTITPQLDVSQTATKQRQLVYSYLTKQVQMMCYT
jgi:hypothetical protein